LDASITLVGRSQDQGSWIRRSTKDSFVTSGQDSPTTPGKDERTDLSESASSLVAPEAPKQTGSLENVSQVTTSIVTNGPLSDPAQITQFIASASLPNLRKFLLDTDKVASICANIIYYIVTPALRGRSR